MWGPLKFIRKPELGDRMEAMYDDIPMPWGLSNLVFAIIIFLYSLIVAELIQERKPTMTTYVEKTALITGAFFLHAFTNNPGEQAHLSRHWFVLNSSLLKLWFSDKLLWVSVAANRRCVGEP